MAETQFPEIWNSISCQFPNIQANLVLVKLTQKFTARLGLLDFTSLNDWLWLIAASKINSQAVFLFVLFFRYNDQKNTLSLKIGDLEPWASKQVKSSSEWPPRLGNCCRTSRWHSLPSKQPFVNTSPQPKKRVDHNLVSSRVFGIGKDLDWIDQWRRELKKIENRTKSRSWIPELNNTHHQCHASHSWSLYCSINQCNSQKNEMDLFVSKLCCPSS